jgi:outer membrane autotransporter protein
MGFYPTSLLSLLEEMPRPNFKQAVFFKPYITYADKPADGGSGYDTSTFGFFAGYETVLSPSVLLGLHGGVGKMDIDFTGGRTNANSEDVDIYVLGAHGTYAYENWRVQAAATPFAARHDYRGRTGTDLNMAESDTYTSYGAQTAVTVGYGFDFGNVAILPEVGVAHSWIHGEGHTTDANAEIWQTRYGSYDITHKVHGTEFEDGPASRRAGSRRRGPRWGRRAPA